MKRKLSNTYRLLRLLGFNYSIEEYGQISLIKVLNKILKTYKNAFLFKFCMESFLFAPINPRKLRPKIMRMLGCKVGKHVFVGSQVYIDSGHANLIVIDDYVHITARCLLLCHQRDIDKYRIGCNAASLKYRIGKIHLKKGCMIGMNTTIMPGVTIGEGAIVGACSLVTKDVPAWTIAVGNPAKVVKKIEERKT